MASFQRPFIPFGWKSILYQDLAVFADYHLQVPLDDWAKKGLFINATVSMTLPPQSLMLAEELI